MMNQEIGQFHGATVQASDHREYGEAIVTVLKQPEGSAPHMDKLFEGITGEMPVSQDDWFDWKQR
jgi:GMP synthase (glutamine-hydrolysing)